MWDATETECKQLITKMLTKIEGNEAKSNAAKKQTGKKRHAYTAKFKAEAIHALSEEGAAQKEIADKYGIKQCILSR